MNLVSKDVSQQLIAGETVQMIIMKENLDINNLTDITIGIQFHTPLDLYIAISSNPVMNTLKKIWYSNKIHFIIFFILWLSLTRPRTQTILLKRKFDSHNFLYAKQC